MREFRRSQQRETDDAEPPASRLSRRRVLKSSAGALTAAGLGFFSGTTAAQMGSVPDYADFVPAGDDRFVLPNGATEFASVDFSRLFELLIAEPNPTGESSETVRFQFEPQILAIISTITPFTLFGRLGFGDAIPAATVVNQQEAPDGLPDLLTERVTAISTGALGVGVSVSEGSYDTDALAAAVAESPLTESSTAGVFVGADPRYSDTEQDITIALTWTEEYIIAGPSVDLVATVRETGRGQQPRLHEQNSDVARQLSAAGHGDFSTTSYAIDGEFQINDQNSFLVDYTAIENAQLTGYTQSNSYDLSAGTISATSVFTHPSTSASSESVLSGVGGQADERSVSSDGRFITIETTYQGAVSSDDSTDDSDDSTDGGSDSGGTDGSESGSDMDGGSGDDSAGDDGSGDDGSSSSDDGGPGFGLVSALTGLGGAGYLLKRRTNLGENCE
ncbi:PGF-CTERM sorting domain-containing protein [Halovenus halobia]|uniref:PGF-CTERM sorting domain-containing protein n=1 Tax=Halovenus halobia TaxID=3396622 RepID=UPI003F55A987